MRWLTRAWARLVSRVTEPTTLEKIQMCLAEVGIDPKLAELRPPSGPGRPERVVLFLSTGEQAAALLWSARWIARYGAEQPCWACWKSEGWVFGPVSIACGGGHCSHLDGPARPPRELLRHP